MESIDFNTREPIVEGAGSEELRSLAKRYPWWGALKLHLHKNEGAAEGSLLYAYKLRERLAPQTPNLKSINPDELRRSPTLGIIDEFLREGEHKITIGEGTTDEKLDTLSPDEELEEEFVSEELAEIYAKQHLFDLAIEIYQKLSLQDSQKSIYFAELIEELKKRSLQEDNKK